MKTLWNRKCSLCVLFLVLVGCKLNAQETFRYTAKINKVPIDGFYRIRLSSDILAKSKQDLSDVRIIQQNRTFVPYVSQVSLPRTKASFMALPILRHTQETDSTTVLVVENSKEELWHSLWLNLRNSKVWRSADLSGSSDLKNWFVIDEGLLLGNASPSGNDNFYSSISFPSSSYKYFRLKIFNKDKSPLNITQVGHFLNYKENEVYQQLPLFSMVRKDSSDKCTYLRLQFKDAYVLNKLDFTISAPKYYQRIVEVYAPGTTGNELLATGELGSRSLNSLLLSAKQKQLIVKIVNGDNPPLSIPYLKAWQSSVFIMAYLEQNQNYNILTGDINAIAPDYDLRFFTDQAMKALKALEHEKIAKNALFQSGKTAAKKNYTYLMWAGIITALGLLLLLTRKMLKELGNPA